MTVSHITYDQSALVPGTVEKLYCAPFSVVTFPCGSESLLGLRITNPHRVTDWSLDRLDLLVRNGEVPAGKVMTYTRGNGTLDVQVDFYAGPSGQVAIASLKAHPQVYLTYRQSSKGPNTPELWSIAVHLPHNNARSLEHNRLRHLVVRHPGDYKPWGNVERWEDPELDYPDCSGGCKWFIELADDRGADWGVCTNPDSHRVGMLTFEHQGCMLAEVDEEPDDG